MTNTNTNEIATTQENGIVVNAVRNVVISETANYVTMQDKETGKFFRRAKYNEYSSIKAESRADKIWLLNIMEGDENTGTPMKEAVGQIVEVANIITRPYDRINEETGETEYGVLVYLITPEKEVFVTSSKTVYMTLNRTLDVFGRPGDAEWENLKFAIGKEKGTNGDIIKIKLVG